MTAKANNKLEGVGQAMVEFALILMILAFIIFVIIEGARIMQASLTAQSAARAAGRYAITGQYDASCLMNDPPCSDPRVESIKAVARKELTGLQLADGAAYEDPNYYLIEVIGSDENGEQIPDYAGVPGGAVMVRVTYRVGMVTPLTRPIAETVRVLGQVVMNNERYTQVSTVSGGDDAPVLTPFPTPGPSPTTSPPDLEVSKSASVDPAVVDVPFIYSINVVNLATTGATNVQMVDQLPPNFTFHDSPSHGNDCSANDSPPIVTCELGDIAGNGGVTVDLEVSSSAAGTNIENTASATYPSDPDTSNNTGRVTIDIVQPPSNTTLNISKGASTTIVAVDGELIYSVSVVNAGIADAQNVQFSDAIPASMTIISATSSQGTCSTSGNDVSCALGSIARNGSATVTIRVRPGQEGNIVNTAFADADNADAVQDSVSVEVRNIADLGVTKSASRNPGVGEDMIYTVSVVNNGPANATGVSIVDTLPASVAFISALPSQGSCSENGNVVSCSLGTINDGAGVTINVTVRPNQETTVTNNVTVDGAQEDPYAPNNTFNLDTVIQPRADLSLAKTGPETAVAGETIRYDITVENSGPSRARGVFVYDTLPDNVSFVAAAASGASSLGTCNGSNSSVTCALGDIPRGGVVNIEIWIIPRRGGFIYNNANVASNTIDPNDDNNDNFDDPLETYVDGSMPYILLDPVCGSVGATVTISGYNFQDSNPYEDIDIRFDGSVIATISRPASGTHTWTYNMQIPAVSEDDVYQVEAHQLRPGQTGIRTYSSITVPCPKPNLIISRPQLISGTPVIVGRPVEFTAEVTNIGNLDAISQFFAGLYVDPAPAPTGGSTHIDQNYRHAIVALNGLAAGASKTVTFTVEAGFSTAGTHQVYAVADSDPGPTGVISPEHIETDNISEPRQVSVRAAATATPTATATAGATATPTVTPTPGATSQPGGLVISVNNDEGQPQANAEITIIDEDSGEVVATGHSDTNGTYFFENLPAGTYTATVCIVIENSDYYAFTTGIVVSPGAVAQRILFLQPAPGGCT